MPKSLSEKRTVWSENTLEERLLNHKRCTIKKNQKFKLTSSKIQRTIRKTLKKTTKAKVMYFQNLKIKTSGCAI